MTARPVLPADLDAGARTLPETLRGMVERVGEDTRVQKSLEPTELRWIPEDELADTRAVDLPVLAEHARPEALDDRFLRLPVLAQELVHDLVARDHLAPCRTNARNASDLPAASRP